MIPGLSELGIQRSPQGSGLPYLAYPNEHSPRWLVPAEPALRRSGAQFCASPGARGGLLRYFVREGILGSRIWLEEGGVSDLGAEIARVLGRNVAGLAISTGTPGAYRKLVFRVMAPGGHVLAYAKAATHSLAAATLESERSNLGAVSAVADLRGGVPEVLGWFRWRDSLLLLLSPGPDVPGPSRFGPAHIQFLVSLHKGSAKRMAFRESFMWRRAEERVNRLRDSLPLAWATRYGIAMDLLAKDLGSVVVPLGIAHGDFAPWNTRRAADRLFVFDWEAAAPDMPPLHDAFHFHAIQAALLGRRFTPRSAGITDLLGLVWPEGESCLLPLCMAYVVDTSLYYAEAMLRAPNIGETRVLERLGEELDCLVEGRHELA